MRDTFSPSTDAVLSHLLRLLPHGQIWDRVRVSGEESLVTRYLAGCAEGYAELYERIATFFADAVDPRSLAIDVSTGFGPLRDWEEVLGLPDPCDPSPSAATADRRAAAHAKLIAQGGQSPGYLEDVLEAHLGVAAGTVSIDEAFDDLFLCDESVCGDPLTNDGDVFTFYVTGTGLTVTAFVCDTGACGDALVEYSDGGALACVLDRIKPAHTSYEIQS